MLKVYSKDEFFELLEDRIEKAGGPTILANQLNISASTMSSVRANSRNPPQKLLEGLGLRVEKREITYTYTSNTSDSTTDTEENQT